MRLSEIREDKDKFVSKLKDEIGSINSKVEYIRKAFSTKRTWNIEIRHTGNAIGNPHFVVYVTTPNVEFGTNREGVETIKNFVEETFEDHRAEFHVERIENLADGRHYYAITGSIYIEYPE